MRARDRVSDRHERFYYLGGGSPVVFLFIFRQFVVGHQARVLLAGVVTLWPIVPAFCQTLLGPDCVRVSGEKFSHARYVLIQHNSSGIDGFGPVIQGNALQSCNVPANIPRQCRRLLQAQAMSKPLGKCSGFTCIEPATSPIFLSFSTFCGASISYRPAASCSPNSRSRCSFSQPLTR
jgi:hypothetical protein